METKHRGQVQSPKLTLKSVLLHWMFAAPLLLILFCILYSMFHNPRSPNQPPIWLIAGFPITLLLGSSYLIYLPFKKSDEKAKNENFVVEWSASPWYADYAWSPDGTPSPERGGILFGLGSFFLFFAFGMSLSWEVFCNQADWRILILSVPITLLGIGSLVGTVHNFIATRRFGNIRLKFTRFPYAAGEDLVLMLEGETHQLANLGMFDAALVFYDYYLEVVDRMKQIDASDNNSAKVRERDTHRYAIEVHRETHSHTEPGTAAQVALKFTGDLQLTCRPADKKPQAEWEKAVKTKARQVEQTLRYADGSTCFGFSAKRQNTGERFCQLEITGRNHRNFLVAIFRPEYKASFRIPVYTLPPKSVD